LLINSTRDEKDLSRIKKEVKASVGEMVYSGKDKVLQVLKPGSIPDCVESILMSDIVVN
jgi:hypothetical protein